MKSRNGRVINAAPVELREELQAKYNGQIYNQPPPVQPAKPVLTVIQVDPDGRHAPSLIALLRDSAGRHVVRLEREGEMPGLFALAHLGFVKPGFEVSAG
jgi:hypothetical protein